MPLTHVCIWDPKIGYRRITIDEACEMYPYRVSARSGHFVCELCAQNVLLTAPGENVRHFRHDPGSPNKECDERQAYFDPTYGRTMGELSSHEMPLRILVTGTTFSLQLGFFRSSGNNAHCDRIKIAGDSHQIFEYSFERVGKNGTTYLSVGSIPNRFYEIEYRYDNGVYQYQPVPEWRIRDYFSNDTGSYGEYRRIAIALLNRYGTIPEIKAKESGTLMEIKVGYRLPPSEEEFFKLYSWPVRYDFTSKAPQVFTRKMTKQVFPMFKSELEKIGYCFAEE